MPGLIGSQGVRPGALNMNRVFRALRYRSEQAQYVTYHRPTIYKTDDYGVPSGTIGSNEILVPDLPAIIRPAITADYSEERLGSNIIGAARIYTPNITTIKNYANFDQDNNTDFNEIEGWDRLITNYRTIFNPPTSGTANWTTTNGAITSDGESVTNTLTANGQLLYTATSKNALEADRIRFKIKTNFTLTLTDFKATNISNQVLTYSPTALTVPSGSWLTIDVPYLSGSSATSVYRDGTRYATTIAGTYDYEKNLKLFELNYTGFTGVTNTLQIKEVEFYKSVSWHVHSLKDMTDGYIIFNCVRTKGRYDSRRRAYE
jgi:hypothetical protein|tara:strand:+ start:638 stop:1591 length:954 start_codon:yes stop_codon:yes gene_type:complete